MDLEFGNFDFDKPNNGNMQDLMDKVDNLSIDWDKFGEVNENSQSLSKSNISDMFNKSKKSQKDQSVSRDFQNSRDIDQISMIYASRRDQSFRYQVEDNRDIPRMNNRYQKLQQLLNQAKKNSLDVFYKKLQTQNKAYEEIPAKFNQYRQFKNYTKQLKLQKRQKEEVNKKQPFLQQQMQEFNPFQSNNYNQDNKNMFDSNPFGSGNFKKKQPIQNIKKSDNFSEVDFFVSSQQDNQSHEQKGHFANQQKLPDFFPDKSHNSVDQFYDMVQCKRQKHEFIEDKPYYVQQQQVSQSFNLSGESNKFQKLLSNYKNMRTNFQGMLQQLKNTSQGQQKIVQEIRQLKQSRLQNEAKYEQTLEQRRQQKQIQKNKQNEQIREIKEEVEKINSNTRDIMYLKMNQKIQQLQEIVRMALHQVNQEKQQKIQPKVINYFCDHDRKKDKKRKQVQSNMDQVQFSQQENVYAKQTYSQTPINNRSPKDLINSRSSNNNPIQFRSSPNQHQSTLKQSPKYNKNDFCSPLDLCFDEPVKKEPIDQIVDVQKFKPEQFAKQYFPKQIQYKNRNMKNCLTQKSSIIFQSFEFHISARFCVVEDPIHPLSATIRVGNKCSIDLADVHTIVYGPQGPGLQTQPPKMFDQIVKKGSSFSFTVFVNKQCLEDNGFSLQISYKTQGQNKKKVNLKVPLPLIQLIKPQFIYEEQFNDMWNSVSNKKNQLFMRPKILNVNHLRSHEDLKLILPFIDLTEQNQNIISYGIMFKYPKSQSIYMIKLQCYISGKASLQMRTDKNNDQKIRQQILDVLNFLLFDPSDQQYKRN